MEEKTFKKREIWIDALKGIACFCVLNSHSFDFFNHEIGEVSPFLNFLVKFPFAPLFNGSVMVCVFAVMSGLLMSKNNDKIFNPVNRIIRRYIQLSLPIMVIGVIAFLLGNLHIGNMKITPLERYCCRAWGGTSVGKMQNQSGVLDDAFAFPWQCIMYYS